MAKKKKLPIIQMDITDDLQNPQGMKAVALVDEPAIEEYWMKFEKHEEEFLFEQQKDKQIITGALMVADMPIYRKDADGTEYYVTFSKDVITKIVKKFSKLNYFNRVNLMHDSQSVPEGIYLIELFQSDKTRGVNAPKAFSSLADGSLFASYYVENPELWQFIQTDQFRGFSIEGIFGYVFSAQKSETDELMSCISECLKELDKLN